MIIRLPIDIKSLYLNIKNDNESGHTATVATPLKQYGSVHEELLPIFDIPENINQISKEELIGSLMMKSRAEAKIIHVCVFDKISVNGVAVNNIPSYCIYVREETAPTNVHCGRQKVHYPTTFKYSDSEIEINNKLVMRAVSEVLHDYAFIVEAFEYDTDTKTLNFDATIVGANDIPYSKVFINQRGAGNKFRSSFNEDADNYDSEIIALREKLGYSCVTPDNYSEIVAQNKMLALDVARSHLLASGARHIRNLYEEYPYSLYDFEYRIGGKKYYSIVRHTATTNKYFSLPFNKIKFCSDFSDCVTIILITDVNGEPQKFVFSIDDMNGMNKSINSISYEVGEG